MRTPVISYYRFVLYLNILKKVNGVSDRNVCGGGSEATQKNVFTAAETMIEFVHPAQRVSPGAAALPLRPAVSMRLSVKST